MGMTAAIGLTLASGIWKAKTEYDQNKAAARQAEANAAIADLNADKLQAKAYEDEQNNALNRDVKKRQMTAKLQSDLNSVGGSNMTLSGSNLRIITDSQYEMAKDLAIEAYNGRNKTENIFQQSTDQVNQRDQLREQARQYNKAAKNSIIKNVIETGASIALMGAGNGAGNVGKAGKTAKQGKQWSTVKTAARNSVNAGSGWFTSWGL